MLGPFRSRAPGTVEHSARCSSRVVSPTSRICRGMYTRIAMKLHSTREGEGIIDAREEKRERREERRGEMLEGNHTTHQSRIRIWSDTDLRPSAAPPVAFQRVASFLLFLSGGIYFPLGFEAKTTMMRMESNHGMEGKMDRWDDDEDDEDACEDAIGIEPNDSTPTPIHLRSLTLAALSCCIVSPAHSWSSIRCHNTPPPIRRDFRANLDLDIPILKRLVLDSVVLHNNDIQVRFRTEHQRLSTL